MQNEFGHFLQSWFDIPAPVAEEMKAFFQPKPLQKGDFFLKAGQPAHKMAFVQSGIVREFLTDEKGREVTKWVSTPGYFITDIAGFLFGQPARWSLQALTDCELLVISQADYAKIGQQVPQWPELEKRFLAKCFTILEQRVVTHLSMTSEERYNGFFAQSPELFNLVPLQFLASMLGMTPETFSRIRKKQAGRNS